MRVDSPICFQLTVAVRFWGEFWVWRGGIEVREVERAEKKGREGKKEV